MKGKKFTNWVSGVVVLGFVATMDAGAQLPTTEALNFNAYASSTQEPSLSSSAADQNFGRVNGFLTFNRRMRSFGAQVDVVPAFPMSSNVTAAHLHCARAGQDGEIVVDLDAATGVVDGELVGDTTIFDNTNIIAADCEVTCGESVNINTISALYDQVLQGCIYLNVHTEDNPNGEARAQLLVAEDDE